MIRILYNILLVFAFVLALPGFIWRMIKRGGYGRDFMERFCVLAADKLALIQSRERIWIHAVSVGEMQIALGFIEAFRKKAPATAFLISTTTSTAHAIGKKKKHADDVLVYMPLDFQWITESAMRLYRPRLLLLTETEIWPNLIRAAKSAGVRTCIINGRIAEKTARWYAVLGVFFRPVIAMIDLALMRSKVDADRFVSLGADSGRVQVVGNAKYDIVVGSINKTLDADMLKTQFGLTGATVIVGGSTWPGEEVALAGVYSRLSCEYPELRLVLVPRHMERRNEIAGELRGMGLECIKRSDNPGGFSGKVSGRAVCLVDTTGELVNFYSVADIVYVGRSLFNQGGQNMIEPAFLGKPVVMGPNVSNFRDVADLLKAYDALVEVADVEGLEKALRVLLDDKARRAQLGANAKYAILSQTGVMGRYVDTVLQAVPS